MMYSQSDEDRDMKTQVTEYKYDLHIAPDKTTIDHEGVITTHHFTNITVELWNADQSYKESVTLDTLVKAYESQR